MRRPRLQTSVRALLTIPKVGNPRKDPVYGRNGPLRSIWDDYERRKARLMTKLGKLIRARSAAIEFAMHYFDDVLNRMRR